MDSFLVLAETISAGCAVAVAFATKNTVFLRRNHPACEGTCGVNVRDESRVDRYCGVLRNQGEVGEKPGLTAGKWYVLIGSSRCIMAFYDEGSIWRNYGNQENRFTESSARSGSWTGEEEICCEARRFWAQQTAARPV
jgi:hypothetical protein